MNDHRYEIKFVLDEAALSRTMAWLYRYTSAKIAHSARIVNSVYFDDPGYSAVRDNLAGISERRKIRLRWYHDDDPQKIYGTQLEVKHRNGRLGFKDRFALLDLNDDLLSIKYRNLFTHIHKSLGGDNVFLVDDHFLPTLHVSYKREYYEGLNGIRVTFDHPITFYSALPHACPFDNLGIHYPNIVMEIKFPTEQKEAVAASLRHLNMTPRRHSKYLVGIAAFGQALYY